MPVGAELVYEADHNGHDEGCTQNGIPQLEREGGQEGPRVNLLVCRTHQNTCKRDSIPIVRMSARRKHFKLCIEDVGQGGLTWSGCGPQLNLQIFPKKDLELRWHKCDEYA